MRKSPDLNRRKQFIKGHEEELFVHYYETMGTARSYGKLMKYCGTKGWINKSTAKLPTRMTLWFSLWRWAIHPENQAKAYKIYNAHLLEYGEYISPEQWSELLNKRAKVCLRAEDYDRWKEKIR